MQVFPRNPSIPPGGGDRDAASLGEYPIIPAGVDAFPRLYAPTFDLIRLYFQPNARRKCLINGRIQVGFWRKSAYFSTKNAYFTPKTASFPVEKVPKTGEPQKMQKYGLQNPPNFSDPESRQKSVSFK